jgi:hypothetical protein
MACRRRSSLLPATRPTEARRRSTWASRKLRLLRAHGPIHKVTGTHRYHLTKESEQNRGRWATGERATGVMMVQCLSRHEP